LSALAVFGFVRLVRMRCWPLVVAIVAFAPGMAAFLVLLAARHIYVPPRYAAPIDLAGIVAASPAAAWLAEAFARVVNRGSARVRAWWDRPRVAGLAVLALCAVLGAAVAWPTGVLDRGFRHRIANSRALSADVLVVKPVLRAALNGVPGAGDWADPATRVGSGPVLLAPTLVMLGLGIDLDVPLSRLGPLTSADVDAAAGRPAAGQIVFHDRHADAPYRDIEVVAPAPYGGNLVVPLAANARRGYWVVRIQSP
jgi:hypothetical protein